MQADIERLMLASNRAASSEYDAEDLKYKLQRAETEIANLRKRVAELEALIHTNVTPRMKRVLQLLADGWWIDAPGETNLSKMYCIQKGLGRSASRVYAQRSLIERLKSCGFLKNLQLTDSGKKWLNPDTTPAQNP